MTTISTIQKDSATFLLGLFLCIGVPTGGFAQKFDPSTVLASRVDVPADGAKWLDTGDIDGDGRLDLIARVNGGSQVFLNRTARGSIVGSSFIPLPMMPGKASGSFVGGSEIAVGDFDGDGRLDLARDWTAGVSVDQNLSAMSNFFFNPRFDLDIGNDHSSFTKVLVDDVDGDGRPDLFFIRRRSGATYGIHLYRNLHVEGLLRTDSFDVPLFFTTPSLADVTLADLDGDGKRDRVDLRQGAISVSQNISTNGIIAYKRQGGLTTVRVGFPDFGPPATYRTAAADLDGDGRPDLIATDRDGSVSLFRNLVSGTNFLFGPEALLRTSFTNPQRYATDPVPFVADVDLDGRPDILFPIATSNVVAVLRNVSIPGELTTNSFVWVRDLVVAQGPSAVAQADLDGDGKLDLVIACNSAVSIFRSTVNRPPNVVALTNPGEGSVVQEGDPILLMADAWDDGVVVKVEFFDGESLVAVVAAPDAASFHAVWTNAPPGLRSITARAYDEMGGTGTSASVRLTVNARPVVTLDHPISGETVAYPNAVLLQASATDSDGTVIKVEFFDGVKKLGEALSTPYTLIWSNAVPGVYHVAARATDSLGGTSVSSPVELTVLFINQPPTFRGGPNETVLEDSAGRVLPNWASAISAGPPHESSQRVIFTVSTDEIELFAVPPTITLDGTLAYTPAAEASGTANVVVVLRDNGGNADGGQDSSVPYHFSIRVLPVNDPPTAAINMDQLIYLGADFEHPVLISCNWWNACMVADGRLSSDPEDSELSYLWFLESNRMRFGEGSVVTNCLEVGEHTVVLSVTDSGGLSDASSITIEVVTAPLAIELLIEQLHGGAGKVSQVVPRKTRRELTAALRVALAHASRERLRQTQKSLDAFEKKVRIQVAGLDPEAAAAWIRWSQAVSIGIEKCIVPPQQTKGQHGTKDRGAVPQ